MPTVPCFRDLTRHSFKWQVHAVEAAIAHQLYEFKVLMEKPYFDSLWGVQPQMRHFMLVLNKQTKQALDVRLLEEKVILIKCDLAYAVCMILVTDLFESVFGRPNTNFKASFVVRLLRAVGAIERAAPAGRQDRIVGQTLFTFEGPRHLSIAFKV